MKAIRIHEYGGMERVVVDEIPTPEIADDEVLIRVAAASVNPLDLKLIGGLIDAYFPLTMPYAVGTDLSGTVVRVGALAQIWKPGDRVIARLEPGPGLGPAYSRGGAFAEFAAVPARHVATAPSSQTLAATAGLPTAAGTAWQALIETAGLKTGQTVLVHGGAGGVGGFAIQIAKRVGATVIATASANHAPLVRELGADRVIDYRDEDFSASLRDVSVVLDTVGGETQTRSYAVLRSGGWLVSVAAPPDQERAKSYGVTAVRVGYQTDGARLGLISGACDRLGLRVVVDRAFPLANSRDALAYSTSGHASGKILLVVRDNLGD